MNPPTAPAASFDILLMMFGNAGSEVASTPGLELTAGLELTDDVSFASLLTCREKPARVVASADPYAIEDSAFPPPACSRPGGSSDVLHASLGALPIGVLSDSQPPPQTVSPEIEAAASTKPDHSLPLTLERGPIIADGPPGDAAPLEPSELDAPHQFASEDAESLRQTKGATVFDGATAPIIDHPRTPGRGSLPADRNERPLGVQATRKQTANEPLLHAVKQAFEKLAIRESGHPTIAKLRQAIEMRVARLAPVQADDDQPAPTAHAFSLRPQVTQFADGSAGREFAVAPTSDAIAHHADPAHRPQVESPDILPGMMDELTVITARSNESENHTVIDLALPELGTVQIEVSSDADETAIRIQADPPLHLLIRENLHEFVAALSESGIELAGFDLRQHGDSEQSLSSTHAVFELPGGMSERSDATTHSARTGLARYRLMSVTA